MDRKRDTGEHSEEKWIYPGKGLREINNNTEREI